MNTLVAPTTRPLQPPDECEFRWYADNLADHADHSITYGQHVIQHCKTVIERTTERFLDEGDFTVYAIKVTDEHVMSSSLYCDTCDVELDVPNTPEWAT